MESSGIWLIAFILYFVPSVVAYSRDTKNKGTTAAINILLGWTGIGWIISFGMAVNDEKIEYKSIEDRIRDKPSSKRTFEENAHLSEIEETKYYFLSKAIEKAEDPSIFDSHIFEELEYDSNIVKKLLLENKQKKEDSKYSILSKAIEETEEPSILDNHNFEELEIFSFDDGEIVIFDPKQQERKDGLPAILWSNRSKSLRKYFMDITKPLLKELTDYEQKKEVISEYQEFLDQRK